MTVLYPICVISYIGFSRGVIFHFVSKTYLPVEPDSFNLWCSVFDYAFIFGLLFILWVSMTSPSCVWDLSRDSSDDRETDREPDIENADT